MRTGVCVSRTVRGSKDGDSIIMRRYKSVCCVGKSHRGTLRC